MILKNLNISKDWTLFLDRDGVINHKLEGDYVKDPAEFRFIDGTLEAMKVFTETFGRIVVVTNQQGIGKGLMSAQELDLIHGHMLKDIEAGGGKIDRIYYCPGLREQNPFCRKPNVGMALQARKDFPEINFKKSIIAGDSKSDMQLGKRLHMKTVLVGDSLGMAREFPALIDYCFSKLLDLSKEL